MSNQNNNSPTKPDGDNVPNEDDGNVPTRPVGPDGTQQDQ